MGNEAEWSMVRLTGIIAAFTVLNVLVVAFNVWVYYRESEDAGKQTQKLIEAANIQAGAAERNAGAASSFSTSADGINSHTKDAVAEFQRLAKATESSATQAAKSMVLSQSAFRAQQRAWVGVSVVGTFRPENMKPIIISYMIANAGRTIARNVDGFMKIEVLPKDQPPVFIYDPKQWPAAFGQHFAMGALFPNSPQVMQPYWIDPNWGIGPDRSNPTKGLLGGGQYNSVEAGDWYIATYGRFTYDDVFGVHHWITFCNVYATDHPDGAGAQKCAEYNDADTNE